MNAIQYETTTFSTRPNSKRRGKLRRTILTPMVSSIGAGIGIFGGIAALFSGLICCVIHELFWGDTVYNQVATTLLVMAIPMILLGSVLLDEVDAGR